MKTTTAITSCLSLSAIAWMLSACPCTTAVCEEWRSAPFDAELRVFTSTVAVGLGGKLAVRSRYAAFPGYEVRDSGVSQDLLSVAANGDYASCPYVAAGRMGAIAVSYDSGKDWEVQGAVDVSADLNGVAVSCEGLMGIAVGDAGAILLSDFKGDLWTTISSGSTANLKAVAFGSELEAVAVGERGTILRTGDGGMTWDPVSSGTNEDLLTVAYDSVGGRWFVGGTAGVLLSMAPGDAPVVHQTDVSERLQQIAPRGDGSIRVLGERRIFVWSASEMSLVTDHELNVDLYAFVTFGVYGGLSEDSLWVLAEGGKFLYYNEASVCECEGRY